MDLPAAGMDLGAFEMELAGCLAAWGGALMLVLGVHQPEHRKKHHGKFGIYHGMVWYIPWGLLRTLGDKVGTI